MAEENTTDTEDTGDTAKDENTQGSTVLTTEDSDSNSEDGKSSDDKASDDASKDADTTDNKSEDGKADTGKDGTETYEFVLPDDVTVDADAIDEFKSILKDGDVSNETAQSILDLQLKAAQASQKAQDKEWADTQDEWRKAGENDEEFGKGKYEASVVHAKNAIRELGGQPLMEALEDTGMGNHPEFIRFFARVGKAIGEDKLEFGSESKGGKKSIAERMFPNQGK